MISGPLPICLVAQFLGKSVREIPGLIKDEGLPAIPVNAARKPVYKVYFSALLDWINQRASGQPMTAAQLESELERCLQATAEKRLQQKKKPSAP